MQLNLSQNQETTKQQYEDIKELYLQYAEQYDRVFIDSFGDAGIFIYKTLGRKDYKDILDNENLELCDKEEVICEICTLFPTDYDFANSELGGLPTLLANRIVELSLLSDVNKQINAIHYYRDKLANDLDDQINCVIHEAFPEFTMNEIENWDADKSANYMARAEYILNRLRGVPLAPTGINSNPAPTNNQQQQKEVQDMNDRFVPVTSEVGDDKHKLTPEKLAQLERDFPNINWRGDSVMREGIEAFKNKDVDCRAMANQVDEPIPEPALELMRKKAVEKKATEGEK